jgi:hypothetical protein
MEMWRYLFWGIYELLTARNAAAAKITVNATGQ